MEDGGHSFADLFRLLLVITPDLHVSLTAFARGKVTHDRDRGGRLEGCKLLFQVLDSLLDPGRSGSDPAIKIPD